MNKTILISIKRAYDAAEPTDGLRILVDALWPRGKKKEDLACPVWAKQIAPSSSLRRFFHEDIEGHWTSFAEAYRTELRQSSAFASFIDSLRQSSPTRITLVYGSRFATMNHALVLQEEINRALSESE